MIRIMKPTDAVEERVFERDDESAGQTGSSQSGMTRLP
jgi:hypothetical protein